MSPPFPSIPEPPQVNARDMHEPADAYERCAIYFSLVNKMIRNCGVAVDGTMELMIRIPESSKPAARCVLNHLLQADTRDRLLEQFHVIQVTPNHLFYVSISQAETVLCLKPHGLKMVFQKNAASIRARLNRLFEQHINRRSEFVSLQRSWGPGVHSDELKLIRKYQYYHERGTEAKQHMSHEIMHDEKRALIADAHCLLLKYHTQPQANYRFRDPQHATSTDSLIAETYRRFKLNHSNYARLTSGMDDMRSLPWDDPMEIMLTEAPCSHTLYVSNFSPNDNRSELRYDCPRLTLELEPARKYIIEAQSVGIPKRFEIVENRILFWRVMGLPSFGERYSFMLYCAGGVYYYFEHKNDSRMRSSWAEFRKHAANRPKMDFRTLNLIPPFTWEEVDTLLNESFDYLGGNYVSYGAFKRRAISTSAAEAPSETQQAEQEARHRVRCARLVARDLRRLIGRLLDRQALDWVKGCMERDGDINQDARLKAARYWEWRLKWTQLYKPDAEIPANHSSSPSAQSGPEGVPLQVDNTLDGADRSLVPQDPNLGPSQPGREPSTSVPDMREPRVMSAQSLSMPQDPNLGPSQSGREPATSAPDMRVSSLSGPEEMLAQSMRSAANAVHLSSIARRAHKINYDQARSFYANFTEP